MGKKTKYSLVILVALILALVVYLRPIWWETYRYENDRIEVHVHGTDNDERELERGGTLVIRLTGRGKEICTWDPLSRKTAGPATEHLQFFDSISAEFTDDAGYASAGEYSGLGSGKRSFIFGGCRRNLGYLLILSKPGFTTRVVIPHVGKLNPSFQVISPHKPHNKKKSALDHARDRLYVGLRLLYPVRVYRKITDPERSVDSDILLNNLQYWQHLLPDGRSIREYAIENLMRGIEDSNCPRIKQGVIEILANAKPIPSTEDAIVTEHNALVPLMLSFNKSSITSCELGGD